MKLYEDYSWLAKMYLPPPKGRNKTAKEIGDFCNVTEMTIWNHLNKAGLLKLKGKGRKLGARTSSKKF